MTLKLVPPLALLVLAACVAPPLQVPRNNSVVMPTQTLVDFFIPQICAKWSKL